MLCCGLDMTFASIESIYAYMRFTLCFTSSGKLSFFSENTLTGASEILLVFSKNSLFLLSSSASCSFYTLANSASLSAYSRANSVARLFRSDSIFTFYSSFSLSSFSFSCFCFSCRNLIWLRRSWFCRSFCSMRSFSLYSSSSCRFLASSSRYNFSACTLASNNISAFFRYSSSRSFRSNSLAACSAYANSYFLFASYYIRYSCLAKALSLYFLSSFSFSNYARSNSTYLSVIVPSTFPIVAPNRSVSNSTSYSSFSSAYIWSCRRASCLFQSFCSSLKCCASAYCF